VVEIPRYARNDTSVNETGIRYSGWIMTVFLFVTDVSFLAHSPDARAEMQEAFDNDENIKELRATMQQYLDKGAEALDTRELREKLQNE
jgi:hypothetical protein